MAEEADEEDGAAAPGVRGPTPRSDGEQLGEEEGGDEDADVGADVLVLRAPLLHGEGDEGPDDAPCRGRWRRGREVEVEECSVDTSPTVFSRP